VEHISDLSGFIFFLLDKRRAFVVLTVPALLPSSRLECVKMWLGMREKMTGPSKSACH
jgi:hypothetical protein